MSDHAQKPLPSARQAAAPKTDDAQQVRAHDGAKAKPASGRGRGRRGKRAGKRHTPPPARSIGGDAGGSPDAQADESHIDLEVDGETWRASIKGRGLAGRTVTPAPIMLLGFESLGPEGSLDREAWLPGERLDGISLERLTAAFGESRPRPADEGHDSE